MKIVLEKRGLKSENIKVKIDPEGEHNEAFWRNNFKEAFMWFYQDEKK